MDNKHEEKKMNLVEVKNNKIFCSSKIISDKFEIKHARVVVTIKKMLEEYEEIKGNLKLPLIVKEMEGVYRGQTYIYYLLNKKAFSLLIMRFKTKSAKIWQSDFFDAFSSMEKVLAERSNVEWIEARKQGKIARSEYTDVIQNFVDYATEQGSQNAIRYYTSLTKMEYVALRLIESNEKVPKQFRDVLDNMALSQLFLAESIAKATINQCMKEGRHYKEIYQLAKHAVEKFAESTFIINNDKLLEG